MTAPSFVHLRLHTDFSLVDGVTRVKPLVQRCAELNMPAVAVTDDSNLFGLIKFYDAAIKAGVKPIAGADLWVEFEGIEQPTPVCVLVLNTKGYKNLTVLISRAWQHNQQGGKALVKAEWLAELNEGLILLSGGTHGALGRLLLGNKVDQAKQLASWCSEHFPNRFYLEVQRASRTGDEACLHATVALATELGLPIVATNDVRFISAEDFEAHEVRVCIHESFTLEDPRREKRYTEEQYLKSP